MSLRAWTCTADTWRLCRQSEQRQHLSSVAGQRTRGSSVMHVGGYGCNMDFKGQARCGFSQRLRWRLFSLFRAAVARRTCTLSMIRGSHTFAKLWDDVAGFEGVHGGNQHLSFHNRWLSCSQSRKWQTYAAVWLSWRRWVVEACRRRFTVEIHWSVAVDSFYVFMCVPMRAWSPMMFDYQGMNWFWFGGKQQVLPACYFLHEITFGNFR